MTYMEMNVTYIGLNLTYLVMELTNHALRCAFMMTLTLCKPFLHLKFVLYEGSNVIQNCLRLKLDSGWTKCCH